MHALARLDMHGMQTELAVLKSTHVYQLPVVSTVRVRRQGQGRSCACNGGYDGDGKTCTEQNACLPKSPCDPNHGVCTKTGAGRYLCSCDPGYSGTDVCSPINACESRPCLGHAACQSTGAGTFECTCEQGWKKASTAKCVEVDGCESNPCAFHALCHSQPAGTFSCNCPPGYVGDGINKCAANPLAIDDSDIERLDIREKNFDQDVDAVEGELERVETTEDVEHDNAQDYRLGDVKKIVSDVDDSTNALSNTIDAQANTLRSLNLQS